MGRHYLRPSARAFVDSLKNANKTHLLFSVGLWLLGICELLVNESYNKRLAAKVRGFKLGLERFMDSFIYLFFHELISAASREVNKKNMQQVSLHVYNHLKAFLLARTVSACVHLPHETRILEQLWTQPAQVGDLCAAVVTPELQSVTDAQPGVFLSKQDPCQSNGQKLLQKTPIPWNVSLSLLWIQLVPLVFNYLSQYGYGRLSGAVKITPTQEVNKVVIYEGSNNKLNKTRKSGEFVSFQPVWQNTLIFFTFLHPP